MTTWRDDAACRGMDVNLFYPAPHDVGAVNFAKKVCAACPVSDECLLEILVDANYDNFGIFGGTSAIDRRKLRRQLGISETHNHKPVMPCGTAAAYQRHMRKGEPACAECRAANSLRNAERYEQRPRARAGT